MSRKLLALAGAIILSLGGGRAAQLSPALQAALAPLAEGVPPVAIERLQIFLAQNPPAAEQDLARKKLAEALIRAGRPADALPLFANPSLTNDLEAVFVHS